MSFHDESRSTAERFWPPAGYVDPAESLTVVCTGCHARWHIHQDLAGFKKQCDCGTWIQVPSRPGHGALLPDTEPSEKVTRPHRQGAVVGARSRTTSPLVGSDGPSIERAAPHEPMSLRERAHVPNQERRRQLGAMILELGMIGFALMIIPTLFAAASGSIDRAVDWMPVSSALGGVVVLGIVSISPFVRRQDFGLGRFEHWAEAMVATAGFFVLALAFQSAFEPAEEGMQSLVSEFDTLTALFVIAVCPGLFEELAFRGAVFARMRHLFGLSAGILYTSITFALAHGHTIALPIHLAIGLYLTWLRHRSGTIWPGVLCHLCYNGALVLWTIG